MIDAAPANHRPVVPDRVARVLTEVLSPVVLAYGVCLAVSIGTTPPLRRGVVVGLAVATLTAGLPFAVVLWSSRRGRLSGRHIPVLRQRPLVLLLAAGSTVFAFVATGWLGADPAVRALVLASFTGLLIAALISLAWKISIHVAAAAGAVTVLGLVFGVTAAPLALLVVALAWARVRLGEHDILQVVAGGVVGAVVAAAVFAALS